MQVLAIAAYLIYTEFLKHPGPGPMTEILLVKIKIKKISWASF